MNRAYFRTLIHTITVVLVATCQVVSFLDNHSSELFPDKQ